jgi:general secretion pathway protein L
VVWQAIVTRRDHAQRRLLLRLALVPRKALQPLFEILGKAGLLADWLHTTAPDGTLRRFALESGATRHARKRVTSVLAGATALLAVATIVTPFVTQAFGRSATDRAIAALAPRVAKVEALRKHLAEGAGGADILTAERARTGDVLQVLAALTEIIPDGTWLSELSLHQGKLSFSGQSPAAAQLIPALAADPEFHNPAFAAPVTRAPDGHNDLFAIRAELAS